MNSTKKIGNSIFRYSELKEEYFPLKILDKYLFGEFVKTFLGTLIMLTGILVISQVMDNLKVFLASKEASYHAYFFILYSIPKMAIAVIPPALMFSVCYIVGQFSVNKELVAMMAVGVSFYRIVSPLIFFGGVSWILVLLVSEFVVRPLNSFAQSEFSIIQKGVGTKSDLVYQLHIKGKEGFYYVYWYDEPTKSVKGGFNYIKVKSDGSAEYVISAQNAKYNANEKNWKLEKIEEIIFDENMNLKTYSKFAEKVYNFPESADYFAKPTRKIEEMDFLDLTEEIKIRKNKGIPYFDLEVERHSIFAMPLMCLIVVLIGSIAGAFTKKSAGVASLGITIGVVLLYYIFYSTGRSLGENGGLPPSIAVWSTSVLFLGISITLYKKFNL
ncbi:MAG: LptF/LptG family permease [Leptospiraceae bacterium]|nr:YjgP/YjgQ family permease [Leptospiraceae bacterium]MCK6380726.1 LptF/LptG family permease [Leptospiraceae bacterium]NUM41859.1 YjgP/YjgQ family permease [Leptospiraceae bacterium]